MITSGEIVDSFLVYTIQPFNTCWRWEVIHTHPNHPKLLERGLLKSLCSFITIRQ